VTVKNTGTAPLTLGTISLAGSNSGDFSFSPDISGATLGPNETRALSVVFSPTAANSRGATLTFPSNSPGSPPSVTLTGTGSAVPPPSTPGISVTPVSLTFGSQTVGTSSTAQSVTVRSTGSAPLMIGTITLAGSNPGDFSLTPDI